MQIIISTNAKQWLTEGQSHHSQSDVSAAFVLLSRDIQSFLKILIHVMPDNLHMLDFILKVKVGKPFNSFVLLEKYMQSD